MTDHRTVDSPYAWFRLAVSLLLATIGGVGMWSVIVAVPEVQDQFGVAHSGASLPFTATMIGFGCGGVLLGRLADRVGVVIPVAVGGIALGLGYVLAGMAQTLWQFTACYGVLIGLFGCSATYVPLLADVSHWFERRRGIAVTGCASGLYLAGAIWPALVEHLFNTIGWRQTHIAIGLFCVATIPALSLLLRGRPPTHRTALRGEPPPPRLGTLGLRPGALQAALVVAGVCCCVAMAMPQVQIVAYCGHLHYGPAAGAQMLSLMLACGIVSRVGSGFIADRIGGLGTLLIGSLAQLTALTLYLMVDGLTSLYVVSALFGLFQGGLVPSYAIIVRECFPARQAGTRVGIVIMATLLGMALGGWMSGEILDLTNSYRAAFANGMLWNVANATIAVWLLLRSRMPALPVASELVAE